MGASYKAEAVVLRSLRLGEADRVLHLYTRERGRVGAVAKGIRRTKSRFGARLEPLSHVALILHEGRGELHTVSAAEIVQSNHHVREHPYKLAAGMVALEAVSRLFAEGDPSPQAFAGLCRYLELLDAAEAPDGAMPARDPGLLALQLKLHWIAGFAPQLDACAGCGSADAPLLRFSASAGGAVCASCGGGFPISGAALDAMAAYVRLPLADVPRVGDRTADELVRAVGDLDAEHGGYRLRTRRWAGVAT
jgi:DNA repair protein RecO (recombination protein O)